jgi:hypothetical protein
MTATGSKNRVGRGIDRVAKFRIRETAIRCFYRQPVWLLKNLQSKSGGKRVLNEIHGAAGLRIGLVDGTGTTTVYKPVLRRPSLCEATGGLHPLAPTDTEPVSRLGEC